MATYVERDNYWNQSSEEDSEDEHPIDIDPRCIDSDDLEDAIATFSWEDLQKRGMNKDPLQLLEVVASHREKDGLSAEED